MADHWAEITAFPWGSRRPACYVLLLPNEAVALFLYMYLGVHHEWSVANHILSFLTLMGFYVSFSKALMLFLVRSDAEWFRAL